MWALVRWGPGRAGAGANAEQAERVRVKAMERMPRGGRAVRCDAERKWCSAKLSNRPCELRILGSGRNCLKTQSSKRVEARSGKAASDGP